MSSENELSERLTAEFGKGFTERNLRAMRQFYETFPSRHAVRADLTWTHYRLLMRMAEPNRREFYLQEAADSDWTSRQLERQINLSTEEELKAELERERELVEQQIEDCSQS